MIKTTIYGLPLNPTPKLNELAGASFCVSFATRDKLGKQLDQAIELVGEDGVLLVDNGAFSFWKNGTPAEHVLSDEYLDAWEAWAKNIMDRCPQAVAVIPDVIGGTEEQNAELIRLAIGGELDTDRLMPVWHLDESLDRLATLAQEWSYIAFGSTHVHVPGTAAWHARIVEALATIDAACAAGDGYVRPRIHMMRAQAFAHLYAFDSSDSTNVAVNHNRQLRKSGEDLKAFAGRINQKIQSSCDGIEAEHQAKQPLLFHLEAKAWRERWEREILDAVADVEDDEEPANAWCRSTC